MTCDKASFVREYRLRDVRERRLWDVQERRLMDVQERRLRAFERASRVVAAGLQALSAPFTGPA